MQRESKEIVESIGFVQNYGFSPALDLLKNTLGKGRFISK